MTPAEILDAVDRWKVRNREALEALRIYSDCEAIMREVLVQERTTTSGSSTGSVALDLQQARAFILGWRGGYDGQRGVVGLDGSLVPGEEWSPDACNPEPAGRLGVHGGSGVLSAAPASPRDCSPMVEMVLRKYGGWAMNPAQIADIVRFLAEPGLCSWLLVSGPIAALDGKPGVVGAYGGFWWRPGLWVRRFYGMHLDPYTWPEHLALERFVHRRLWDMGMREAMIHLPSGSGNAIERERQGWEPTHLTYVSPALPRPFVWMRKRFKGRP